MPTASLLSARLLGAPKARIDHWLLCGRLFFPACPSNVEAEAAASLLLFHDSVVAMHHLLHRHSLGQAVQTETSIYAVGRCLWKFALCSAWSHYPAFSGCHAVTSSTRTSIKGVLRQISQTSKSRQQSSVLLCLRHSCTTH